jgi:RNA ligase (TIGR02306 family)
MSTFTCDVVELEIVPHDNADALEIAKIGLYQSIVKKGIFKTGDLAVYIPEAAVCPEEVIKRCYAWDDQKNRGRLAGSNYDRVKAVKLRGVLSQGLVYEIKDEPWKLGEDVQEQLGVTKHVPNIPGHFFGQGQPKIAGAFHGYVPNFDVENIKKFKKAFVENEKVLITEKIHGTCCIISCFTPEAVERFGFNVENLYKGRVVVGTKNLTKRGIVFNPNDLSSIYARIPTEMGILDKVIDAHDFTQSASSCFCLLGEIFGNKIQDLGYDTAPTFRGFDFWVSQVEAPSFFTKLSTNELLSLSEHFDIPWVPLQYHGPYYPELLALNSGNSLIDRNQIKEGIVVRSFDGEKLYKYVSESYLLRKGEATEFE